MSMLTTCRAIAALCLPLSMTVLVAATTATTAHADIVGPYGDDKPSITGKAPRAAKRVRAAAAAAEGDDSVTIRPARKLRRYAARGPIDYDPRPRRSLSGGVSWNAPSGCLNGTLRAVVAEIAASYGGVRVNSTCRSRGHNSRVGGARRSHHLTGDAVDFRVFGNVRGALAYLRSHGGIGGIKHYGGGLIHADTGPRRSW